MSTAISGLNTTLYCGDSATALTKLCDIKDVPDLISEPNLLDATTLSDPMQVNIFGIIQSDTINCIFTKKPEFSETLTVNGS